MSLTSYRAAPPRDKPLLAPSKTDFRNEFPQRPKAPINPVRRLPERATPGNAPGCEGYVPTRTCFGKGHKPPFPVFMTAKLRNFAPNRLPRERSCQKLRKSPALSPKKSALSQKNQTSRETPIEGNAMDQPLKSPGQNALDDAFHAMFELSRTTPAPDLALRLDRLTRLRAIVSDNETRFAQAISADFGHRSTTETAIAETILVLGEIKHAAKHLKKWMAPQRVATALQFMPAKNRLIRQPLGVVGIISPWNYPLQLTLAPAVGAIAAGNRVMIKPSELVTRFSALLKEASAAKFDPTEMLVTD